MIPSKESLLHSEIYNLRAEINAVFHAHDPLMLELANELKIPCTEREQPRGSYELVKEANSLLALNKDVKYFVLRNHPSRLCAKVEQPHIRAIFYIKGCFVYSRRRFGKAVEIGRSKQSGSDFLGTYSGFRGNNSLH